jgi:hypothetical protein
MKRSKYYFPRADKIYLTPNEKWYRFIGILIGMCIGFIISIGIILIAKI